MRFAGKATGLTLGLSIGLCIGLFAGAASAQLINLGDILKTGGAVLIADKFGGQIDRAINQATGNRNLKAAGARTKVVPVLSIGSGGYVGVVQVSGPAAAIDQTKAVGQIELNAPVLNQVRVRALIPINARSITNIKRVNGVGVSALVDVKL